MCVATGLFSRLLAEGLSHRLRRLASWLCIVYGIATAVLGSVGGMRNIIVRVQTCLPSMRSTSAARMRTYTSLQRNSCPSACIRNAYTNAAN